jgi:hypothetical protein
MARRAPAGHTQSYQSDIGALVLMLGVAMMFLATLLFGSLTMVLVIVQQLV